MYPKNDFEYQEGTVKKVENGTITLSNGWSLGIPDGTEAQIGSDYRTYGRGIGSPVRGLYLDGKKVWYRTDVEERQEHKDNVQKQEDAKRKKFAERKKEMDRRYDALPKVFQQRVDKFRNNNPDFRWEYETYEVFCCEEAVKIARVLKTSDAIRKWNSLPYDEQIEKVPISDGHSGNTMGCAVSLAIYYLEFPEGVIKKHGALAPLVGSDEYGCVPRNQHLQADEGGE